MAPAGEPLLGGAPGRGRWEPPAPLLRATFALLGLGSSVLWNQLLLSADVLVLLFGRSALSRACLSQNLLCAVTMIGLTFFPAGWSRRTSILVAGSCYALMAVVGLALIYCLSTGDMAPSTFAALVAADGVLTGLAQLQISGLAGFLSICRGDCDLPGDAPPDLGAALLVGEAAAPLVTTAIFSAVQVLGRNPYDQAVITLSCAQAFLVAGAMLSAALLRYPMEVLEPIPIGKHLKEKGPECWAEKYFWTAMRKQRPFTVSIFLCGVVWIFMLCSFPYIASGLCPGPGDSDEHSGCTTRQSSLMVAAANSAAFLGRVAGNSLPQAFILSETGAFLILGPLVAVVVENAGSGSAPLGLGLPIGVGMAGMFVLWCNLLLIRLFALSQTSVSHSLANRCPITSQITWVALQAGCVVGTGVSFLQVLL